MKVPGFNAVLSLAKDMSNNMISNSVYSTRNESFHDRPILSPQAFSGVCGPCLYHDEKEISIFNKFGLRLSGPGYWHYCEYSDGSSDWSRCDPPEPQ
jgi:hypothetical protein